MDTDTILVPDFASVVGSAVWSNWPEDVDVAVRARFLSDTEEIAIPAEGLMLVLRRMLESFTGERREVHLIFNTTGPHSDYRPVADLVLRWKEGEVQEVKSETTSQELRIAFIGTGPAEPIGADEPGGPRSNTATAILLSDTVLLFDAPPGIRAKLEPLLPDSENRVLLVWITHSHSDAVGGLDEIATIATFISGPPLASPPPQYQVLAPEIPAKIEPGVVVPFEVPHGNVPNYGYQIQLVGYPTITIIHDAERLTGDILNHVSPIMVIDGAGWGRPVFDHWDVTEVLPVILEAGATDVYLTQVGRLVPERPELPEGVHLPKDGEVVTVRPLSKIRGRRADRSEKEYPWPAKPVVPFYFEHFSPHQMMEQWGRLHLPFAVEPKWNGWRILAKISAQGSVHAVTERGVDVSRFIPPDLPAGSVLDGELLFEDHRGRIVPRHRMASVAANPEGCKPAVRIFDVLAAGNEELHLKPYRERRKWLEKHIDQAYLTPVAIVRSEAELARAFDRMAYLPGSEGIVAKDLESTVLLRNTGWSKVKRMIEVTAEVVRREQRENGFVYTCRWKDGPETGKTMVTAMEANPGDTVTVIAQELVPVEGSLHFQNAVVTAVNERPAMTLQDAWTVLRHYSAKWFAGGPLPFVTTGSKARLAHIIIDLLPEHKIYVEPFVGAGGFFFMKPKVEGVREIIGDLDHLKIQLFRFVRDNPKRLLGLARRAAALPPSLMPKFARKKPRTPAEVFIWAIFMTHYSPRGLDRVAPPASHIRQIIPETYLAASYRLSGVATYLADALKLIRRFDSPDTFFYLDPPYPTKRYYRIPFTHQQFRDLLELLKGIKGKFILSCKSEDLKEARKAGFRVPESWYVRRVKVRSFVQKAVVIKEELLVMNYRPEPGAWLKSVADKIVQIPSIRELQENQGNIIASEAGQKALPAEDIRRETEDEETRGERARRIWDRRWYEFYPSDGKGRFVLHRHIRGITEEELHQAPEQLAKAHSVHLDLRLETDRDRHQLFGFTIFLPESSEDPLKELMDGKPFQCAPKQPQPPEWLEVGAQKPAISGPGEVGATSARFARFDVIDSGNYSAGTWNRSFVEIVLRGGHLEGRFVIQRIEAEEGGDRPWVIRKVPDRSIAERQSPKTIAQRLAERGHQQFIYRNPYSDNRPKLVRLTSKVAGLAKVWLQYLKFLAKVGLTSQPKSIRIIGRRWFVLPVTNTYPDLDGDMVSLHAIKEIVKRKPEVPVWVAHQKDSKVGKIIDYFRIGNSLFGIAVPTTEFGRRLVRFIDRYPTHPRVAPFGWATSIHFQGTRDPGDPRVIQSLNLVEVSILPMGTAANPWTGVIGRSHGGGT